MMERKGLGHLGAVRASGHEDAFGWQLVGIADRSYERGEKLDIVRSARRRVVGSAIGPTDETLSISGRSPLRIDDDKTFSIGHGSKNRQGAPPNVRNIETISSATVQDEYDGPGLRHSYRQIHQIRAKDSADFDGV